MDSGMRDNLQRHGGFPVGTVRVRGSLVLGVAVVGSVLVLAALANRPGRRHPRARQAQAGQGDAAPPDAAEQAVPLLEDAVTLEELQQAPADPPVLTDVVVPGRPRR
jgi:hypothetical protein